MKKVATKHLQLSNAQLFAILWGIGLLIGSIIDFNLFSLLTITAIFLFIIFILKNKLAFLLLTIIILGMLHLNLHQKVKANNIYHLLQKENVIQQNIIGTITSEVRKDENRYKFDLRLEKLGTEDVSGKIILSTKKDSLAIGEQISVLARIFPVPQSGNPDSFDYEEFLRRKGIYAFGFTITQPEVISRNFSFSKPFIIIRKFLRRKIEMTFSENSDFVKAIIIGERENLDELRQKMSKAGLSHILAVSGLHTGVISLISLTIISIFIWKKNQARIITIILMFFYAGICDWSPSVTRAMIMINIYLLSRISQRKIEPLDTLAVSFLLITLISPTQIFSIGFQMSFTAVLVLLNSLQKFAFLKAKTHDRKSLVLIKNLSRYLFTIAYFSLLLNIFLAPITLYNFNQLSFNGIIANIIGIFLIGLILPLALLLIILPASWFISQVYLAAFQFIMQIFYSWTDFSSRLPFHFDFVKFSFLDFSLFILLLLSFVIVIKFVKKKKVIIPALLIVSVVLILKIHLNAYNPNLKIINFDCALGDLHLIQYKDFSMLIDTGPTDKSSGYFTYSALPYFRKNGLQDLDYLIITHAHNDHYGGYEAVFKNLQVENVILTDEFQQRKIFSKMKPMLNESNLITLRDTTSIVKDKLKLKFLHPDKSYHDENINNLSITFRLDFGDFSALFTGDIEYESEEYLSRKYKNFLDIDYLKIGHHGSKTATSIPFLLETTPEYCFIPTSLHNRFDFPDQITIDNLNDFQVKTFMAGVDGALTITSDGKKTCYKTTVSELDIIDYEN